MSNILIARTSFRRNLDANGKKIMDMKEKYEYANIREVPICRWIEADYPRIVELIADAVEQYSRETAFRGKKTGEVSPVLTVPKADVM